MYVPPKRRTGKVLPRTILLLGLFFLTVAIAAKVTLSANAASKIVMGDSASVLNAEMDELEKCIGSQKDVSVFADRDSHSLALQVPSAWFGECQAQPTEAGLAAIADARSCILQTVQQQRLADGSRLVDRYDLSFVVEGHTDASPLKRDCGYASNWELSQAQADAVLHRIRCDADCKAEEAAVAGRLGKEINDLGKERVQFSAVGLAYTQPSWTTLCAQIGDKICPSAGEPFPLEGHQLVTWANQVAGRAAPERQRWLRRVDLRMELRPRAESLSMQDVKR